MMKRLIFQTQFVYSGDKIYLLYYIKPLYVAYLASIASL